MEPKELFNLATEYHQSGQWDAAESLYRQIIAADPHFSEASHRLGILCCQRGQPAASIAFFEASIRLSPDNPFVYYNLGLAHELLGQLDSAIRSWKHATRLKPDYIEAWESLLRGNKSISNRQESLSVLDTLIHLQPQNAIARCDRADILEHLGDKHASRKEYEAALAIDARCVRALNNLGNLAKEDLRLEEAEQLYCRAILVEPRNADLHFNRGNVLLLLNRSQAAIGAYEAAIAIRPDFGNAWLRIGELLFRLDRSCEAQYCFEKAALYLGDSPGVLVKRLILKRQFCDWSGVSELTNAILSHLDHPTSTDPSDTIPPLLLLGFDPPVSPEQILVAGKAHHARAKAVLGSHARQQPKTATRKSRLRIGYLSADLREHPVGQSIVEVIESHDRSRFETVVYSFGPDDASQTRARIATSADRFYDVSTWSLSATVEKMLSDDLDFLIDLQGPTGDSRPEILASRVAPIQVLFLGFAASSGMPWYDFYLGDDYVLQKLAPEQFSEQLARIPGCFMPADSKRYRWEGPITSQQQANLREAEGLPSGAFVLCAFSPPHKITKRMLEVWLRAMQISPTSVLWLRADEPIAQENLKNHAKSVGIDSNRLIFAKRTSAAQHLSRHRAADLYIDTYPYNQHSTAGDAIRTGLPLLTCSGINIASRVAGSFLHNLGLDDLIAQDFIEYEAKLRNFLRYPETLAHLRGVLAQRLSESDIFDGLAYSRKLEKVLFGLVDRTQE